MPEDNEATARTENENKDAPNGKSSPEDSDDPKRRKTKGVCVLFGEGIVKFV